MPSTPGPVAGLALATLLLAAPSAGAAVVAVETQHDAGYRGSASSTDVVTVVAPPGEANALDVSVERTRVRVGDVGAALVAGPGCAAEGIAVVCDRRGYAGLEVAIEAADGDDGVRVSRGASHVRIHAGDGDDDVVVEGAVTTLLDGGAGADRLTGAPTALNRFEGGPGADVQLGGSSWDTFDEGSDDGVPDRIDGGGGRDRVTYQARTAPLTIDLAAGVGGVPGERDELVGIEGAGGGAGVDRVVGDDGANELWPGPSAGDVLEGRAGDDILEGGGTTGDGGAALHCGAGRDRVAGNPAALGVDCDRLDEGPVVLRLTPAPGGLTVRIAPEVTDMPACAAEVGDQVIRLRRGRGRITLRAGTPTLRVRVARRCPPRGRLRPAMSRPIALLWPVAGSGARRIVNSLISGADRSMRH